MYTHKDKVILCAQVNVTSLRSMKCDWCLHNYTHNFDRSVIDLHLNVSSVAKRVLKGVAIHWTFGLDN